MDDATQKLVDGLRLDARDYGRKMRGEVPPEELVSWDQSNVRAWGAADALEAAQRPPVSDAGEADLIDVIESAWTDDDPEFSAVIAKAILARFTLPERPPVSPEQREALDELIADVLIAERDEWPRDPGDAPSEVLAGAVTDALLARFSLPVLDVEKVARLLVEHREARFADGGCKCLSEAVCGCGAILPQTFAPPAIVFGEWWLAVHQARVLIEALPTLTANLDERSTT